MTERLLGDQGLSDEMADVMDRVGEIPGIYRTASDDLRQQLDKRHHERQHDQQQDLGDFTGRQFEE